MVELVFTCKLIKLLDLLFIRLDRSNSRYDSTEQSRSC